jgi:ribosomal protein S12
MPTIQQLVRLERVANKKKKQNHPRFNLAPKDEVFVLEFILQHQKNQTLR